MNWDIATGRSRQFVGRLLQTIGARSSRRKLVLQGEQLEYGGRLQTRYGTLKHQVQWQGRLTTMSSVGVRKVQAD